MIILDCGSGTQCKNNLTNVMSLIEKVDRVDNKKREVVFKWQLFTAETIDYLEPLDLEVFTFAYYHAKQLGYKTTASFFDEYSFNFLNGFELPFLKIAARDHLYPYISKTDHNVIVSVDSIKKRDRLEKDFPDKDLNFLYCVPEYPANPTLYETKFGPNLSIGISDHTCDTYLKDKYNPLIWEKHFILSHDTSDPYGDDFCFTPKELKEIIK